MENNEQLFKFKNIDLVDYINKKHPKIDLIEIESEKNALSNLIKTVNEDVFQYFLQRQDPLLKLLEIHQECFEIIKSFKKSQKDQMKQSDEIDLSSSELKKKFCLFTDDMSIFLTNDRYFVASAVFNNDTVLCVLTNDLIFIGEKDDNDKFRLRRSLSKESVKLEMAESTLRITLNGSVCELSGSKVEIENFFEMFQEVSYKLELTNDRESNIDYELVEYYLETKKFVNLIDYLDSFGRPEGERLASLLDKMEISDEYTLFALSKISDDPTKLFKKFFYERFKAGLSGVNRIQKLDKYILDVFEYIQEFSQEFYEYCERNSLTKRAYILTMEDCVKHALQYIEPRVINHSRGNDMKDEKDIIGSIYERLQFSDLNFRYLIKEINIKKAVSQGSIEQSKRRVKEEVEKFLRN
ncbi:uncharacterized protein VICG_00317 [Vittaforma corneae ATCC 50505]|uniref:Uncharacterized protein n=1 Tax=Vittaforma corneae (strain ATCC 50505) TaxID=993615 RepID=L2GPZ2_VITCO|nr:uncharacterized protein VICG_00317 [Vittaforma corneae ATCC 50505]ELA42565.1 hypothetical protein VICG_00317 [Vittaforma corneae ATCC 50505]